MNRFAFASSIVLSSLALAACGDDTASSSGGGGGGTSASTGSAASSGSQASSNASSGTPASSSSGEGGGESSSVAGTGGAGGDGGAPGVGGAGAGGDPGVGGGSGECAEACDTQDFTLIDDDCQTCALASAQGACGAPAQACLTATADDGDADGCVTCGEIVQGGDPADLCASNQDEAAALLTCVCGVCG